MNAFLVLLLCLGACVPQAPLYDYAQEPDPRNREYILGVGDELSIHVRADQTLSTDVVIRPDGTITMPIVGDFKAAGETPTALKNKIRAKLVEFVKIEGTELTVAVSEINSYHFSVSGEVETAGVYSAAYYVTVVEAVALAGGFSRFASRNNMKLMRRDPSTGDVRVIPLVYDLLASGKRPDMNLYLLPGDALYVP